MKKKHVNLSRTEYLVNEVMERDETECKLNREYLEEDANKFIDICKNKINKYCSILMY